MQESSNSSECHSASRVSRLDLELILTLLFALLSSVIIIPCVATIGLVVVVVVVVVVVENVVGSGPTEKVSHSGHHRSHVR
jgi:hypothetical protein